MIEPFVRTVFKGGPKDGDFVHTSTATKPMTIWYIDLVTPDGKVVYAKYYYTKWNNVWNYDRTLTCIKSTRVSYDPAYIP